jgi:hypothetical protein
LSEEAVILAQANGGLSEEGVILAQARIHCDFELPRSDGFRTAMR